MCVCVCGGGGGGGGGGDGGWWGKGGGGACVRVCARAQRNFYFLFVAQHPVTLHNMYFPAIKWCHISFGFVAYRALT